MCQLLYKMRKCLFLDREELHKSLILSSTVNLICNLSLLPLLRKRVSTSPSFFPLLFLHEKVFIVALSLNASINIDLLQKVGVVNK